MAIERAGILRDNVGTAIAGATVELFPRNTTTTAEASTNTNASGVWSFSEADENRYDVRITSGSSVRFHNYDSSEQMQELEVSVLKQRNPPDAEGNTFTYEWVAAAIAANRTITLPLLTGNDTMAVLGFAQSWTASQTFTADTIHNDTVDIHLGSSSDAALRWSTADADNHALVLAVGNSNQGLHITDLGAIATDWNIAATTHPNAYIHSNTSPATDYLRLGDHDGTTAYIDVVGGTTLAFEIDGTTEMSMTASVLNLASGNTYQINGTNVLSNNTLGTGVVTSSLTTVGALNSGSITSGFGAIDNGASNITTTGDITGGGIHVTGDTAAGDNAALGYTSAEGLILTGQGSTSDITIKNDADADVLKVATGTTTITLPGALSVDDATDSTSGTTGSIHTDGGLGVAKNLFVATDARVDGTATLDTVDINAGNIDGTAIGAASASTIVGTTIDASTDFTIGATVITDGVLTDSGGFQIAAALDMNANTISNIGNAGNDFSAHSLNMTASNSGASRSIVLSNTANASASDAYLQLFSGGTSGGNPFIRFDISGGITWGMGADNANGNRFALGSDATLGGRDMFRITTDPTPVLTWNTTHPTGTFDYVCDECGRHGPASFSCCGIVAYHPDVPALAPLMDSLRGQPLTGREPGVQHLVDLGIMEVSTNNDGSPWIGMNPIEAQWYTWSGMLQMHRRIQELEAQVEELCR